MAGITQSAYGMGYTPGRDGGAPWETHTCLACSADSVRLGLTCVTKGDADEVRFPDGRVVDSTQVTRVPFKIQGYSAQLTINVIPLQGHDLILGMAWLQRVKAQIDCDKLQLSLKSLFGTFIR